MNKNKYSHPFFCLCLQLKEWLKRFFHSQLQNPGWKPKPTNFNKNTAVDIHRDIIINVLLHNQLLPNTWSHKYGLWPFFSNLIFALKNREAPNEKKMTDGRAFPIRIQPGSMWPSNTDQKREKLQKNQERIAKKEGKWNLLTWWREANVKVRKGRERIGGNMSGFWWKKLSGDGASRSVVKQKKPHLKRTVISAAACLAF